MKWEGNRESDNVEDRRAGGGGLGGRSIGIGSVAIALVVSYFLGINPMTVLNLLTGGSPAPQTEQVAQKPPADDRMA
ncbi:MAG: neutral zinc metallopeptidase, partial [Rhodoferax sp.]|nr:neutral zinc metallopeptidase [Rhodoferax sp.]